MRSASEIQEKISYLNDLISNETELLYKSRPLSGKFTGTLSFIETLQAEVRLLKWVLNE